MLRSSIRTTSSTMASAVAALRRGQEDVGQFLGQMGWRRLSREAQGRTNFCPKQKMAHGMCHCCWRHGVQCCAAAEHTRMSLTLRVYDDNWGR